MMLTLLSYQTAKSYYEKGFWKEDTLYTLLQRHAKSKPNSFALRDGNLHLTWNDLLVWVDSISESLHQAGLKRGDRVAIWLPSRVESVASLIACARNGYVACPSLHQNYTSGEILELLKRSRAAALVMMPGYGANQNVEEFCKSAKESPDLKLILSVDPFESALTQMLPSLRNPQKASAPINTDPDSITYIAFTSGTTGVPKGVMHSNNTLLANGRGLINEWKYKPDTVILSLSPMSHHIGTVAVEQSLIGGFELVLNLPPAGMSILDWALESKATYIMGVPTHAMDILSSMQKSGMKKLGQVEIFYMAGAAIPIEVAQSFLDMGITPQNIYGMTENGSHQFTSPNDTAKTIVETCGRPSMGYETKIVDQTNPDRDMPTGEVGEIATRGALLMLGYYSNQISTEDSFNRDGWFLSGDLGTLDENGCLRIVGRKKDLIIRGGHNIFPSHIEEIAYRHPGVQKCAVFGVPDPRLGEKVAITLLMRDGATTDADSFLNHLYETGLSKYDMPEYFAIVDSFPLTASGKILKRELQNWYANGKLALTPVRFSTPKTNA